MVPTRRGFGDIVSVPAMAPVIPQSQLPQALQTNWLAWRRPLFTPNTYDAAIAKESDFWAWAQRHGGLKSCCRIPELGAPIWSTPPHQVMPSNGLRMAQTFALNTASIPFTGVDTIVGQFVVPEGWDGAITNLAIDFTGNGFVQGSASIVWRLKIGQRFAKNSGNVLITVGDLKDQLVVPGSSWKLISGQTVQLIANIPVGSPVSGGQVLMAVIGWTYPRR